MVCCCLGTTKAVGTTNVSLKSQCCVIIKRVVKDLMFNEKTKRKGADIDNEQD